MTAAVTIDLGNQITILHNQDLMNCSLIDNFPIIEIVTVQVQKLTYTSIFQYPNPCRSQ